MPAEAISFPRNTISVAFGDLMDDDLYIFCQESDDGGAGCYDNPVTIDLYPETRGPCLFAYNDRRDRSFLTTFSENSEYIPMETNEYGRYSYKDFVSGRVYEARKIARQARFEHGERSRRFGDCLRK